MGMFDKIMGAIFGSATAAPAASPAKTPEPALAGAGATAQSAAAGVAAPVGAASAAVSSVDVGAVLDRAVAATGQKLDWRHSIVDLMKALNLDSSLAARKELAQDLKYTGDMNDSATMNTWLHKALMKKLAENGGKVPADLTG
jgi:Domain of unknown function (DUF3597)